ncbi:hypothetical protein COOONC_10352 [Cooperia oncophora]
MFRRLGQQNYRAESPSVDLNGSVSLSMHSDLTSRELDNSSTLNSSDAEDVSMTCNVEKNNEPIREHRVVEKPEIAMIIANICRKLNTIVNLVHEFSTDALGLRESADDLVG